MDKNNLFAKRLIKRRTEKDITRTQLGEMIGFEGVSGNKNIYKYENGIREPEYDTLVKIAKALDCSTDYLLGVVDEPNRFTGDVNGHHHEVVINEDEPNKPYSKEQFEELIHKLESIGFDIEKLMNN